MAQQWFVRLLRVPPVAMGSGVTFFCNNSRVYYPSLSRCVEYGVLPEPEAERLYKLILKRKGKSMPSAASPAPMAKKKRKPKLMDDEGFDPDMQVSSGDAIGRAVL